MNPSPPHPREQAALATAKFGAELQEAIATRNAARAFELAQLCVFGEFDELERDAVPGERELRRSLHEIIDGALRTVILADEDTTDTWRRVVLPDKFGLFECSMLAANARWLRISGSTLISRGLEALDPVALSSKGFADQARALARFCVVNDGAAAIDYAGLAAALDPRLLPFFNDWLATVYYLSPSRIDDGPAAVHQDAALAALIQARRTQGKALPASSNQSGPAFRAPYFHDGSTRALSVEFNGRQMSSLMQSFAPSAEECEALRTSTLDIQALDALHERNPDELIVCPNWHDNHVIFRCMSPLVERLRERGAPLLRVFPSDRPCPPVHRDWIANAIDIPHSPSLVLAHLCAIDRAIATEHHPDFVFFPEIVPANSSSWMATERLGRVQATGYGFPVTSGLNSIDYFIGGADVERKGCGDDYCEQLILLPGLGVSTTPPPLPSAPRSRPLAPPLDPSDPVRVVATVSHQKLNRELLEAWSSLFDAHPGAELQLFTNMTPAQVEVHLPVLERLLARGSITLHTAQPRQTIIDTLQEADLYLDAFPYGGFNSLVEPLAMGCPVITIEGLTARNRLGAALVRRAGLPESVIPKSLNESIEIAARLLADPGERAALCSTLECREEVIERLADPNLPDHMEAAVAWMRTRGPAKSSSRTSPILISAGERPVSIPA